MGKTNSGPLDQVIPSETPPRAWGRRGRPQPTPLEQRNTPTCVGKTRCRSTMTSSPWKHPHVRGEDFTRINARPAIQETPPRAWGRRLVTGIWSISSRNTPTCVGKTWTGVSPAFAPWKHPHVRGEDFNTALWKIGLQGNTPTCVGKTKNFLLAVRVAQKHPHVRGEDGLRRTGGQSRTETPPRAWGRRGSALVGPRRPKHPHVRGEDQNTTNMAMCQGETPPRAWGRRPARGQAQTLGGNTPTCVGKTQYLRSFHRFS